MFLKIIEVLEFFDRVESSFAILNK
jgi:hypothetical protein